MGAMERQHLPIEITPPIRRLLILAVAALALCIAAQAVRLSLCKKYNVDEFTYGHAAWLISRGQVPYRDFFCHHFPFHLYLMAVPFLFMDDDPRNIACLRLAMLLFLALIGLTVWYINGRHDRALGLPAPLLLFSILPFVSSATEIRPDPVACEFFLAAIAVLVPPITRVKIRGLVSGLLLGLSIWTSEKVLCYGVVFALAFVVDVAVNRKRKTGCLLADPWAFLVGNLLVGAGVCLYLALTHSWSAWYRWSVEWTLAYQRQHAGFSWQNEFWPNILLPWWLLPSAIVGLAGTIRRISRMGQDRWAQTDLLLVGATASTFVSFALQRSPYVYSLIPFFAVLSMFSARGVIAIARFVAQSKQGSRGERIAALAALAVSWTITTGMDFAKSLYFPSNAGQRRMLAQIADLTTVEDPVYDNCGAFVTRPHVSFFYFTNAFIRRQKGAMLATDIPKAILEKECTVALFDERFLTVPRSLREFVLNNFQPMSADLAVWGRHYRVKRGYEMEATFYAIRNGRYFVHPPEAVKQGRLVIDGVEIATPVFELPKGERRIRYDGEIEEFCVVCLPRNGRPFQPQLDLRKVSR
jgi:hypothetical protein